jgi:hypothetical protein
MLRLIRVRRLSASQLTSLYSAPSVPYDARAQLVYDINQERSIHAKGEVHQLHSQHPFSLCS